MKKGNIVRNTVVFPHKHVLNEGKDKMARSSSSFRSLALFLLEHFLLPRVQINLSARDERLKCENCRSSRSFVLYFPQKTLCHFSMSFLLDVLCCHVLSWNSIVNKLFGIDVMIHAGQDDFIVS